MLPCMPRRIPVDPQRGKELCAQVDAAQPFRCAINPSTGSRRVALRPRPIPLTSAHFVGSSL